MVDYKYMRVYDNYINTENTCRIILLTVIQFCDYTDDWRRTDGTDTLDSETPAFVFARIAVSYFGNHE